ncbi:MAG: diphosphomevalonate decarboxylase [Myxococcales bacterium]|nr:diphosphomevalonate decarboxylase [Myxococcales bacterium]
MTSTKSATAQACANIALVKYWGKRDSALNLPAASSLSLTLDALRTTTTVTFDDGLTGDEFELDGQAAATGRLGPWLDLVRKRADITTFARVVSENNFPTASGLASSAAAFAALAVAATEAAGLSLGRTELSELARRGSGSAARSIFGGFALMHRGERCDGTDCVAEELLARDEWPLRMVIAVVGGGKKKSVSSRDAMDHCAETSPLYQAWIGCVAKDIDDASSAIMSRDLSALGAVTQGSAMAMHAAAMASRPPVRYWQPSTLRCLDAVEALQESGLHAYPTMDAGPHVKVLTNEEHCEEVATGLRQLEGVSGVIISHAGPGAHLLPSAE